MKLMTSISSSQQNVGRDTEIDPRGIVLCLSVNKVKPLPQQRGLSSGQRWFLFTATGGGKNMICRVGSSTYSARLTTDIVDTAVTDIKIPVRGCFICFILKQGGPEAEETAMPCRTGGVIKAERHVGIRRASPALQREYHGGDRGEQQTGRRGRVGPYRGRNDTAGQTQTNDVRVVAVAFHSRFSRGRAVYEVGS